MTASTAYLRPLEGRSRVLGTAALSLALFMGVLDLTIANVAIPTIAGNLGGSPSQGTWVITSFAVANAISVPLTGWLTQRFGQVRLIITAILLFTLISWLCGLAPNLETLILLRICQGLVAGPMVPLSQTLLISSYPPERIATGLAIWSMSSLLGPVAGPLLGGWITENSSWRWIFYINIPMGLLAAWGVWKIYGRRESPTRRVPVDIVGLILLFIWVGTMQMVFDRGRELDWFASTEIRLLTVTCVMSLCCFLAWELIDNRHPIIDLSLFRNRNFVIGSLVLTIIFGIYLGSVVLVPLWLQTQMGYTAMLAGMTVAPAGFVAFLLIPLFARRVQQFDPRKIVTIGILIFALASWMRSHFTTQIGFWDLILPAALQGIGVVFFMLPLMTMALSGLPPERMAAATGLNNFVRLMGQGIFISGATTLWDTRSSLHRAQLTEHVSLDHLPTRQALDLYDGAGLGVPQAYGVIDRLIEGQARMLAANDVFWLTAVIFLCMIALIWMARPKQHPASVSVTVME